MRIHGKRGAFYMALAAGDSASMLAYLSSWSISFTPTFADVTAYSDANRISVAQAVTVAGDFTGFFDDKTAQSYLAMKDGLSRQFVLYPDIQAPGSFWSGSLIIGQFTVGVAVAGAVQITSTWSAAGAVTETTGGNVFGPFYAPTY